MSAPIVVQSAAACRGALERDGRDAGAAGVRSRAVQRDRAAQVRARVGLRPGRIVGVDLHDVAVRIGGAVPDAVGDDVHVAVAGAGDDARVRVAERRVGGDRRERPEGAAGAARERRLGAHQLLGRGVDAAAAVGAVGERQVDVREGVEAVGVVDRAAARRGRVAGDREVRGRGEAGAVRDGDGLRGARRRRGGVEGVVPGRRVGPARTRGRGRSSRRRRTAGRSRSR